MRTRAARGLCWMLVFTLPLAMSAGELNSVMVQAKGTVMLNGKTGPASVAAFPGDRLQTGSDSQAMLTRKGSSVLLASNSALTLGDEDMQLHSGSALVTTRQAATVNGFTVVPQGDQTAKFLVNEENSVLKIVALENNVTIAHASAPSLTLSTGEVAWTTAAAGTSAAPTMQKRFLDDDDDDRGLIILIGGLVAAGVIVGILNARDSSPSNP